MTEQKNAPEGRPSPEALLEVARREGGHAGRLKIFVGAAPGVGKTYEMLQTARSKVKDGADVVVGVVETHGRKETKALLRNLEILPPKQIAYKGRELQELDLDALIARRPQIALVDELAHTNAAGSRHPKRYLDVEFWREGDSICLQILDEGPGIPADDLERIFDKFYRVQKGDHVRPGTGLGLAISRGFMEIMHGTLTAANRSDRAGAAFTIRMPAPASAETSGQRRMSAAPPRVLVIDDEPPIRKLLRMGLSAEGYQVIEAPSGKAALEQLPQKPDLIILDLGLPDMQGLDLLRTMRERNEGVPIVVLSSRADETAKVQALDFGADDYVTKPFGMNELLARIRAAMRHQLQSHGERPIFRVGDLAVDLVRRIVKMRDQDVKLSPKEYDLLRLFVQHAGKVLTHNFLLKELWGPTGRLAIRSRLRSAVAAEDRATPGLPRIHPDRNGRWVSPASARIGYTASSQTLTMSTRLAMHIKDFLSPSDVITDLRASNKTSVLQELALRAAAVLKLPADSISAELSKREQLGSTGMGGGIAIPHARVPGVKSPLRDARTPQGAHRLRGRGRSTGGSRLLAAWPLGPAGRTAQRSRMRRTQAESTGNP